MSQVATQPAGTIGILTGDLSRYPGYYHSFLGLLKPTGSTYVWTRGVGIAFNRNLIVQQAHGDWIWFVDDDHTFPPDTLMRLLSGNVDIISPLCLSRKPPFRAYAYRVNPDTGRYDGVPYTTLPSTGIHAYDAVGSGALLVRRRVFEALQYPWFEEGKTSPDALGEDLYFCSKAREAGFSIWLDVDTRIGHMTPIEVWPAQAEDGRWCVDLEVHQGVRIRTEANIGLQRLAQVMNGGSSDEQL